MKRFIRKYWIYFFGCFGFIYQIITLTLMFINDVTSQNDIRMWGGFFPWWTIFFTFTFWSNFFLLVCYFLYIFFPKIRKNHTFLYICTNYISLVLIVVAFALFPAAVTAHNSVDLGSRTPPLSYAALIMPHGPGPIIFIIYAFLIFNYFSFGNLKIINWGWLHNLLFQFTFFIPYVVMIIALNWIPIGAYVINHESKVFLPGFSVYSFFTALNPHLEYARNNYGSSWHIVFFLIGFLILTLLHTVNYNIIKHGIMHNYRLLMNRIF